MNTTTHELETTEGKLAVSFRKENGKVLARITKNGLPLSKTQNDFVRDYLRPQIAALFVAASR